MTRGRESNTAHVVTCNVAPPGTKPYRQAAPESVLADVLQRDGEDLSAPEQIHQAQDWAGGIGHLLTLWSAAVRLTLYQAINEQITARLTESEAFCEASIRDGTGRAARMLAATPELARYSFATAVILGDAGRVRTELGRDPGLCTRVYVWTCAKGATGRPAY